MNTVNIKIEKMPEGDLEYAVGDVVAVPADSVPAIMQSGVVFSITDEKPSAAPVISGASAVDFSVLDQSIPKVAEAIEGLDVDTLEALLDAETAGKTRKGVTEALEAAIAAAKA